jgi:hypothetical protein
MKAQPAATSDRHDDPPGFPIFTIHTAVLPRNAQPEYVTIGGDYILITAGTLFRGAT